MNVKDPIRETLGMSENILNTYLNDLDEGDFLVRPVKGMNHIAWQVGHLISVERNAMEAIKPGSSPALPDGFEQKHDKEAAGSDDASKFLKKSEYLGLFKAQREATKAVLEALSDAELDAPGPERFRRMCPTVGSALNLMGTHVLMHVGQFVAVRRLRGKPVMM